LLSEARDMHRSKYSVDFYKTLSNHLSISIKNAVLFQKNRDIFLHTIEALAAALDARDADTHDHSKNVTKYSIELAQSMGLGDKQISDIKTAGLLHDIGKIGIKDAILLKQGTLTKEEFEVIKTHPEKALKILESVDDLKNIRDLIVAHHERFDGTGYPRGLKGEAIPLGSRILAIADSYDAMTSNRVYRAAMDRKTAIQEIIDCTGSQFDPKVAACFLQLVHS